MGILGMLFIALANVMSMLIGLFIILFVVRAVISWFDPNPANPLVQFIHSATDPVLYRVRQRIPPLGMLDLSVFVVILVLYFLQNFVVGVLYLYGQRLAGP